MDKVSIRSLETDAARCRLNVLRMMRASGHGHIGGTFSCIDVVTALYFRQMKCDPARPAMPERDRFILSAGHKCMAQYAVLAEKGYFDKTVLDTYGALDTRIPGHPNMHELPGIEANTGALGHGLAIAVGMALGQRLDGYGAKTYVVTGDGELAEGSNWEAIAAAAHHRLGNLCVFVDFNGLQISGKVQDIMNFTPIGERFAAFGWNVAEIDGNSMEEIISALDTINFAGECPTAIIARTVKAKGLPFGEGDVAYHYWSATPEQLDEAERYIFSQFPALREEARL